MKTLFRAARLLPSADAPIIHDAAMLVETGRIIAIGEAINIDAQHQADETHDLGDVLVLPGLVNAHVHLELSKHAHGIAPASFIDWLMELMHQSLDPEAGSLAGAKESLRSGVTCVGDISRQCGLTRPALSKGPLRVVSFGEVQAMAQRRSLLDERFAAASETTTESEWLTVGISPHAPYSIEPAGYQKCLEFARRTGRPMATHLAETPEEREFLTDHSGAFARLWESLHAWDDKVPTFAGGPIRFAHSLGLLDAPTLLAHVNECDDEELAILAAGKASVVYCPRTHAYFNRPPHRWREMLAEGINVAVGTDSRASCPDLNLMNDLRLLHWNSPETDMATVLAMGTIYAAKAIGMEGLVGALMPGAFADFGVWPASGVKEVLESDLVPASVWTGGTLVV